MANRNLHPDAVRLTLSSLFLSGFISLLLLVPSSTWAEKPASEVPYEDLRLLSDIYANIKRHYVDDVEDTKLFEGAIHGMLRELDPYSVYLTKKEYKDLKTSTTGKFGGLGIEVSKDEDYLLINSPIPGTPAEKAGLKSGDLIVGIDGKDVKGMSLSDGINLMRGKVGTPITLSIQREGQATFDVKLVRAVITRTSVRKLLLEDGFAYVLVSNFQLKTGEELAKALAQMTKEHKNAPLNGIILDLRSNPGGVLNEAVTVADTFLDPGKLVVYTKGRENPLAEYKTTRKQMYKGIPLVVLINKRSASASEIVAGALKDHKRASIMGLTSFGKASVQTIHPIDKLRALKLTTARYYTPLGHMIHEKGIEPNISFNPKDFEEQDQLYKEKLGVQDESPEVQARAIMKRTFEQRIKDDWQIQRAVAELRTLGKTAQQQLPTNKAPEVVPQ